MRRIRRRTSMFLGVTQGIRTASMAPAMPPAVMWVANPTGFFSGGMVVRWSCKSGLRGRPGFQGVVPPSMTYKSRGQGRAGGGCALM